MGLVNGWSLAEIQILMERTMADREMVIRFCQAVDKQLYLMLPAHMKKSTLHFHLRPREVAVTVPSPSPSPTLNQLPPQPLETKPLTSPKLRKVAAKQKEPSSEHNVVSLDNYAKRRAK